MSGHDVKSVLCPVATSRTGTMADTRYAQVARDLADGIAGGRYPVGSVLPTELALCAHYGASRHTVRAAIKVLQDQGLVSRKKKLGTRVEAATPRAAGYRPSLASVEDLVQFGETHRRVVRDIAEVTADRALARTLGCAVGRRWLRVSSLRLDGAAGSLPIGLTDTYLDVAYADLAVEIREAPDRLISQLVETRFGRRIAEIRQEVAATLLSDEDAAVLRAGSGSAALRIVRRYLDGAGSCFEVSVSLHPADRFTVSMRLTRQQA